MQIDERSPDPHTSDSHDPYRAASYAVPRMFSRAERGVIVSTATWMNLAGGLHLLLAALQFGQVMRSPIEAVGPVQLVLVGVPAMLAALIWSAGRILGRVQRSEQPYAELEASLLRVRTVFRVKGMMVISAMFLCALVFFVSMVLAFIT
jgi:hypothetical protein